VRERCGMESITPERPAGATPGYPLEFDVEYPDRPLARLSSALRIFWLIPIAIVLGFVSHTTFSVSAGDQYAGVVSAGGLLLAGPLVMILFRQKYPRWWFDWNRELLRFTNRVYAYGALMSDVYPSTDEQQYVRLELAYPNARQELNRWLPLVKWLLAIPHYIVLFFLSIGAFFAVVFAWFAILFTGRYPRGLFDFVAGVMRWGNRVTAYAFILTTDRYPPFELR
jgi:hypothetical protein